MDILKIKEIIAKYAKVDASTISENTDIKNDLHLDSIDLYQIIIDVENTFNIKINDKYLYTSNDILINFLNIDYEFEKKNNKWYNLVVVWYEK